MPGEAIDAMCERAKATHWGDRSGTPVIFAAYVDGSWDHIRARSPICLATNATFVNDVRVQVLHELADHLPN